MMPKFTECSLLANIPRTVDALKPVLNHIRKANAPNYNRMNACYLGINFLTMESVMNLGYHSSRLFDHASRLHSSSSRRRTVPVFLLLPPLPLQQNPNEVLEIEVWP